MQTPSEGQGMENRSAWRPFDKGSCARDEAMIDRTSRDADDLIRDYGEMAIHKAAERSENALDRSNPDDAEHWLDVFEAIRRTYRDRPRS
jgi:hypothetical protein